MSTVSGTAQPLSNLSSWFSTMMSSCLASRTAQSRKPRPRVLVIDDEGAIRELLSLYLDSKGLEVATVRSADGARALVAQGKFDLVVLDWMLNGADGQELLHFCKAEHPHIPIVIFSSAELDEGGGPGTGADAVVRKGGPLDALSNTIFRILELRRVEMPHAA